MGIRLLALFLLAAPPAQAATVLPIDDGDTLRVVDGGRQVTIRLACIDAPEMAQAPYGAQSRGLLAALAPIGSAVSLRVVATDRYGRTVAEVLRGSQNVNLQMVRRGQAFAYRQYLSQCDAAAYLGAERGAQVDRLGVWSVPGGMQRPWDFRHGRRGYRSAARQGNRLLLCHSLVATTTAAAKSPPTSKPRSCCGRGTRTWMGTRMGRRARACGGELSYRPPANSRTQDTTNRSHHQPISAPCLAGSSSRTSSASRRLSSSRHRD